MKIPVPLHRRLLILAPAWLLLLPGWMDAARAADPTPAPAPKPKYAALENELALYSPFESPWSETRALHAFEYHFYSLMRVEVRLWELKEHLAADDPNRREADEAAGIVHGEVLASAAEALPLLAKTPNRPLAVLIVHQLESYPFDWSEEGPPDLLASLHRLLGDAPGQSPSAGATPAEEGGGRHRRHRRGGGG